MKLLGTEKLVIILFCSIILFQSLGCCKKKEQPKNNEKITKIEKEDDDTEIPDLSVPDEASKILDKTGLSYSIDRKPALVNSFNHYSDFERKYLEGIKYLESGGNSDFDAALRIFQEILKEYPRGEEASIATLCIAEIYFRTLNNEAALKLYKEIIEKYPGTQAAQNAAEAIKYLENFEKYEKNFVPPDIEDKRRRGR